MTLVKICGITSVEDALACHEFGADMIGFVFADSPRQAAPTTVKHIQRIIGGDVKTVGVFTEESDDVVRLFHECELTYAQLHGGQSEEFARRLGADRVIRVVRVRGEESLNDLDRFENAAFLLFDTYRVGIPGGTGETFDWSLLSNTELIPKRFILSGGLEPGNVGAALKAVSPLVVDVASGVEASPGVKDHLKVKEFIENVRAHDRSSG